MGDEMKKKVIAVVAIVLIFAIAVVIGINFNKKQSKNNKQSNSGQATSTYNGKLPGIDLYYGSQKVGSLNGYTMDMEEEHMRDVIVPVNTDRTVPITISTNGNKVSEISYEMKSTEDNRLIDNGTLDGWKQKDGKITLNYQASAIMEQGTEYFWEIIIKTDKYEQINYYARVMVTDKEFVTEQIKFAKNFAQTALKGEGASKLAQYIEPDSSLPNDNLGQTTIKSSYNSLIWTSLKPELISDITITAKEFCIKDTGEAGTYTMNYQIRTTNAEKVKEKYNVSETITIWSCAGRIYVLAYDREVNQIWTADKNNVGGSFIDLGIQKETKADFVESSNQQFMAFQVNGDVYVMDLNERKIKQVYNLNAKNAEQLNNTKARVITVDDKGNVDYMIYGYSKAKEHVGENGISILRYNYESNSSTEAAFVPCKVSAYNLEKQLSQLCYVGDGTLYIMMNNTIYYANLKTKEWGALVENVEDGSFAINSDGSMLAYNTSGKAYDTENITIVNLKNGEKKTIEAGADNIITVYGYTGTNLIYGIGSQSDVSKKSFVPVSKLVIVDKDYKEVKSYSQNKIYITGVEITDNIINIKRYKGNSRISDDQLLDNTETKKPVAKTSYYVDDVKQKELALAFTNALDGTKQLSVEKIGKVTFDSSSKVNATFESKKENNYYVYGYGKLQGIYSDKNAATNAAKATYGLVTDNRGHKIWVFEENYN